MNDLESCPRVGTLHLQTKNIDDFWNSTTQWFVWVVCVVCGSVSSLKGLPLSVVVLQGMLDPHKSENVSHLHFNWILYYLPICLKRFFPTCQEVLSSNADSFLLPLFLAVFRSRIIFLYIRLLDTQNRKPHKTNNKIKTDLPVRNNLQLGNSIKSHWHKRVCINLTFSPTISDGKFPRVGLLKIAARRCTFGWSSIHFFQCLPCVTQKIKLHSVKKRGVNFDFTALRRGRGWWFMMISDQVAYQ